MLSSLMLKKEVIVSKLPSLIFLALANEPDISYYNYSYKHVEIKIYITKLPKDNLISKMYEQKISKTCLSKSEMWRLWIFLHKL